ncbi:putative C6 finger domain protein [Emericellopsis cladophorae]|uniref:C6 finger domain protein n=1 Tax=Emericellopsis cladophorae TaxID=2686198 RepID=A0A9Q0BER7_9HYPO|nr:putative C6 finger domain protein [Emericellopsis cladophorae]KAI6782151.1 putative C6 finger domain protein [Emericellopsis cladophorae]
MADNARPSPARDISTDHDLDQPGSERPSKKPRVFLARQACESCRAKKTRKEESFGTVLGFLKRIETKVENLAAAQDPKLPPAPPPHAPPAESQNSLDSSSRDPLGNTPGSQRQDGQAGTPNIDLRTPTVSGGSVYLDDGPDKTPFPFSAHAMLEWEPVRAFLPQEIMNLCHRHGWPDYATALEKERDPIPGLRTPTSHIDPLSTLSISTVRNLCEAYFCSFNLAYPVLDRDFFEARSLAKAVTGGFGYDMESCVVLVVMALGCWGIRALEEAGFHDGSVRMGTLSTAQYMQDGIEGLVFFNEARRRIGLLSNDHGLQNCQFHLLSGIYYSSLLRPVDWWESMSRAANCCMLYYGNNQTSDASETSRDASWTSDMQGRLFWITIMLESVVTEELALPHSRLDTFRDRVPLPRFIELPRADLMTAGSSNQYQHAGSDAKQQAPDVYYHFLSQVAVRNLTTRIKEALYCSHLSGNYPSPGLDAELSQQLERWREHLPCTLNADVEFASSPPSCPRDVLVSPLIRARYLVLRWHLCRPVIHRMLSFPEKRTTRDIERCKDALLTAMKWLHVVRELWLMKSCMPIRYPFCSQLFGQIVLVYCLRFIDDGALAVVLPDGYQQWTLAILELVKDCAPFSPSLYRDSQIAEMMCSRLQEP